MNILTIYSTKYQLNKNKYGISKLRHSRSLATLELKESYYHTGTEMLEDRYDTRIIQVEDYKIH